MAFSFDDYSFGMTSNGRTLDVRLVARPQGMTRKDWYNFAGRLARLLNERLVHGA